MKHANIVIFLTACCLIGSAQAAKESAKPTEFAQEGEVKNTAVTATKTSAEMGGVQNKKNNRVQSEKKRLDKKQPVIDMGCVSTE